MKKRMFLSTILMTLVLLVAVTTATFAWYEATANANAKVDADTVAVGTQASGLTVAGYYITVEYDAVATSVDLTDPEGNCWVISNGVLMPATAQGATEASLAIASFSVHVYLQDAEGEKSTELTQGSTDYKNALAAMGVLTYKVMAAGDSVTRIGLEADTYGNGVGQEAIEIGTLSIASGVATLNVSPVYYSVTGQDDNQVPTAGTAATEDKNTGLITISLVAVVNG